MHLTAGCDGEIYFTKKKNAARKIVTVVNVKSVESKTAEFNVKEKGAYRVEVYFYNKAWIYSNHIRIGLLMRP